MFLYECAKELQLVNENGELVASIPFQWIPEKSESMLTDTTKLRSWFQEHGPMNWHRDIPGDENKFKKVEKPAVGYRFKGVLLEVGHGPSNSVDPGAVNKTHRVSEFDMNWVAAKAAQKVITEAGIPCDVTDQAKSLYELGQLRRDYDLFVSVHHNAFNGRAQYTMTMTHARKQDAADRLLGKLVSKAMAKRNGFQDQGVKDWTNLGILSGAEDVERDPAYQASILAECYFIDNHYLRKDDFERLSRASGEGIGAGCLEYLKTTN